MEILKELIMKCEDCGYKPEPNKDESNENWEHYDTTCPKCGGDILPDFKEGD